jgi:hypothetical protein
MIVTVGGTAVRRDVIAAVRPGTIAHIHTHGGFHYR